MKLDLQLDDFYNEYEIEEQVEDFVGNLLSHCKNDIIKEMERLRKENAKLSEIKAKWRQIELEREAEKHELAATKHSMLQKLVQSNIEEILAALPANGWSVEYRWEKLPKCNKCDNNRFIHYKSPRGFDLRECCECDKSFKRYYPAQVNIVSVRLTKETNRLAQDQGIHSLATYCYQVGGEPEYSVCAAVESIEEAMQFYDKKGEFLKKGIVFTDKEMCEQMCEQLTNISKERQGWAV